MTRNLFVVARHERALHAYMLQYFAGRPDVDVVLDRRQLHDRRQRNEPVPLERRHRRRRVRVVDVQLGSLGFAVVTVR